MRLSRLAFCGLAALFCACSSTQDFTTTGLAPSATGSAGSTLPPSTTPGSLTVVTLAKDQGLDADDPDRQGPWRVATDTENVYWLDAFGAISRVAKTGGAIQPVAEASADPTQLQVQNGYVYYSDIAALQVMRVPATGGAPQAMTPAVDLGVAGFAVDGASITYVDLSSVYRCDALPCAQPKNLWLQTTLHPTAVTTNGDDVFVPYLLNDPHAPGEYLDSGGIYNTTTEGLVSTLTVAYDKVVVETDATLAGHTVVYAVSGNLIVKASYPGDLPVTVILSGEVAAHLQIAGAYLYWLNGHAVRRMKKDVSAAAETVWPGDDTLNDLFVDADGLYVATNNGRILRLPRPADESLP